MKSKLTCLVLLFSIVFSLSAQSGNKNRDKEMTHLTTIEDYIREGKVDLLKKYVAKNKIDLNYYDDKYGKEYLLVEAALSANQMESYRYLMEVDDVYKRVYSDLLIAALKNDFDTVISLLEDENSKYDVDDATPSGITPLMFAIFHQNKDAVVRLADLGADINSYGNFDISALTVSMYFMNKDIAQFLIQKGADVNEESEDDGKTMLHHMVDNGDVDRVRFVLELGADVDSQDRRNNTPLMLAVKSQNLAIVELLLQFDPDIHLENDKHETAWTMIIDNQNNKNKKSAKSEDLIAAFLKAGADINAVYFDGQTLPIKAVDSRNKDAVRFLIRSGADVNIVDENRDTALYRAEMLGDNDIVKLLKAAGAK